MDSSLGCRRRCNCHLEVTQAHIARRADGNESVVARHHVRQSRGNYHVRVRCQVGAGDVVHDARFARAQMFGSKTPLHVWPEILFERSLLLAGDAQHPIVHVGNHDLRVVDSVEDIGRRPRRFAGLRRCVRENGCDGPGNICSKTARLLWDGNNRHWSENRNGSEGAGFALRKTGA